MAIQLSTISNPVISRGANEAARDMAIFYEGGTLYCFYSSSPRINSAISGVWRSPRPRIA